MRFILCAVALWSAHSLHAEDGVRLPHSSSATVTHGGREAKVSLPFGSIIVPMTEIRRPVVEPVRRGEVQAETRGRFRLSYALARSGKDIVAQNVRVRVENEMEYHAPETDRLREHEGGHAAINEREAHRIERKLSAFRTPDLTPAQAGRRLKDQFRREVDAVRRLHAEWDENHVFVSTGAYPK